MRDVCATDRTSSDCPGSQGIVAAQEERWSQHRLLGHGPACPAKFAVLAVECMGQATD